MEGVFTKKNLITYLILAILALAIPLSVRIVQLQQIFTPKAAGDEVKCDTQADPTLQEPGGTGTCVTKTDKVNLLLDSPYGQPGQLIATPSGIPISTSSATP